MCDFVTYEELMRGPDEFDRLDEINRLAYAAVNPVKEDFEHWEYFLNLVKNTKSNLLVEGYVETIKRDMIRVCPEYGDFVYGKLFSEKTVETLED